MDEDNIFKQSQLLILKFNIIHLSLEIIDIY